MTTFMDTIVDTELLIGAVEERPEIWDSSNEHFRNREVKEKSWEEIASNFILDFSQLEDEDKKAIVSKLQKRWRTVRDAFKRSRPRSGVLKSSSESKKQSKYHDSLKFLEKNMEFNGTETYYIDADHTLREVFEQSDMEEEEFETIEIHPKIENTEKKRSSKRIASGENSSKHSPSKYDGDKSFLDSLLPTLQTFNEEQKLQFRIEVLSALQRVKSMFPEQQPPAKGRGSLKSFVLTPDGELKEEPKKPKSAAERMRKMRERRKLALQAKKGQPLSPAERQRCKSDPDKPGGSATTPEIPTPASKVEYEDCDNFPNSKKLKLDNETSVKGKGDGEIDSVILIWTELLSYKLQEFDIITREYLMNETDNNVFKAKIKMMKQKLNQSNDVHNSTENTYPVEVRYVDISNINVSQHQDQLGNATTSSVTTSTPRARTINKCEIVYVNPTDPM